MAQSLSRVLIHLVFGTKGRRPFLDDAVRDELKAYMSGTLRNCGTGAIAIETVSDHVHLLCALPRTLSVSDLVKELKTCSSRWLKGRSDDLRGFAWQSGYGAFSVSESRVADCIRYINRQAEHHRRTTFETEFVQFLRRHKVEFDERYVWD